MDTLIRIFKTGFFHIFGAGSINALLSMVLNIVIVRILPMDEYGAYAYAFSIVSFFVLFSALGAPSAAMQVCSELFKEPERSDACYSYAYRSGVFVDGAMALSIVVIGVFIPLAIPGSNALLLLYCAYPLFLFLNEMKLIYLRIWLKNRDYAFMTNVQTCSILVCSVFGAFFFQAAGLIVGQNVALLLSWAIMCIRHPYRKIALCDQVEKGQRRDFWKIALISALNNGLGGALSLLGTFFVGLLLMSDDLVAVYKVATTIPFGLLFLPTLMATFVYPHFVRHRHDRRWTIRHYLLLVAGSAAAIGLLTLVMVVLAEPILTLLFGVEYAAAVPPFVITASVRQVTGNLLVSQRKLLFNTFVGGVSLVSTTVLSYLLMPAYGMVGAAWSYTLTMLIGGVINTTYYLFTIFRLPDEPAEGSDA